MPSQWPAAAPVTQKGGLNAWRKFEPERFSDAEVDTFKKEWRASASPFYPDIVMALLYVHLFFAVTTAVLWSFVVIQAYRHFPQPPLPGPYSARHRLWGWLAAIDMALTAATGWTFYVLAFVC